MLKFVHLVQAAHCIVCVPDLPPSLFSRENTYFKEDELL